MKHYPEKSIDITILTDPRYVNIEKDNPYAQNIEKEETLVREHLEQKGLRVNRIAWDDKNYDWSQSAFLLFRSTWDYFERYQEFISWLEEVKTVTSLINSYEIIKWNLDKHYMLSLAKSGVHIPPSHFIEKGEEGSLADKVAEFPWKEIILKPVVSAGAWNTFRFYAEKAALMEEQYQGLIGNEAMMIQEFQENVPTKGELSFMLFGGRFTHAVLKKAKKGDFRVQDDFGGSVFHYDPSPEEIGFAEDVLRSCTFDPIYARVDVIWDNQGNLALSELELFEPELWFRLFPNAAGALADIIIKQFFID